MGVLFPCGPGRSPTRSSSLLPLRRLSVPSTLLSPERRPTTGTTSSLASPSLLVTSLVFSAPLSRTLLTPWSPSSTRWPPAGGEGMGAAMSKIYADIGFAGLWRGLVARVVMIGTLTGLQWFIFDGFKVFVGLPASGGKAKVEEKKE